MRRSASFVSLFLLVASVLRADCPTPNVAEFYAWQSGIGVGYSFPVAGPPPGYLTYLSINDLGIADDIHAAFNQWTYANQSENPSNVSFHFSGGGTPFEVYAARVNFPGVPFLDPGEAAHTYVGLIYPTSYVGLASVTFYFESISPSFGYVFIDPSADNFHTYIQKVMVHEIGHTMGLADQPVRPGICSGQIAGQSVMNLQCETNDSLNNLPAPSLGLPSCDNQSVIVH